MTTTPPASTIPVVTAAEADPYMATTARNPAWLAIDAVLRDNLLIEAQRWLKDLCPNPDAEGCCGVFDDAWTAAVSELALAIYQNPTAIISGASTAQVKRVKLGDLEQEFFQTLLYGQARRYGPKAPLVLQAFPWLGDLLGCWLPSTSARTIPVERN